MSTIKVDTLQTRAGSTAAVTGAGSLKVDNLRGNTAATSITLGDGSNTLGALSTAGGVTITGEGGTNTTNLQQGLAKAWIQATSDSSISTQDSFNYSSVTDTSAGRLTPNFSTNMSNNDFSAPMVSNILHMAITSVGTGSFHMTAYNNSHSETDTPLMCCTVHGDLA